MFQIKNIKTSEKLIITLLLIGFLVPLTSFLFMSLCGEGSVNDCLYATRWVFPDFFYQYNTMRYIYHHGAFPSYLIISDLGGEDGTQSDGVWRSIYHAPIYYYFGALIFLVAKSFNISDLFLLYFASLSLFFFINLFFFLNIKQISKQIFKRIDNKFVIYSLIIFLFLPVHLHLSTGIQSDIPLYLLYMIALFYYFKILKYKDSKYSAILGIVLGISLLARIASLIFIGGFLLQMVYFHLKKNKTLRNCLFKSLLIGVGIGSYPFIRNIVLFKNPIGDMRYELAMKLHKNIFYTMFRVIRAYWGGIFGGNDAIRLALVLFIVILCVIILFGLVLYFKKYRSDYVDILFMVGLSTFIISFLFMCKISYFLQHGVCQGDTIQDRYLAPLNPLIAVFGGIALIKIRDSIKNRNLKVLPDIFVGVLALLFIIDFLTAVIHLN